MHRLKSLLVDLVLVAGATVLALVLRDNLEVSQMRLEALAPYLATTLIVSAVILPMLGISQAIWHYTAMADYLRLVVGTVVVVLCAVALSFGFNRLEGVPRALPVLQGLTMLAAMVGVRVLARVRHAARAKPIQLVPALQDIAGAETVLVVGLNRLTELYLRSVAELAPHRVLIAGLLGRSIHHKGRFVHRYRVLGTPDQIADTLRELQVHGVFVNRVVVTSMLNKLSPKERAALLDIEKMPGVRVDFLAEKMGLDGALQPSATAPAPHSSPDGANAAFRIGSEDLAALARRPYWRIKRVLDVVAALTLLIVLAPLMMLAAALVAIDLGRPVTFWQQRPGLGGHPFRLYKLRTMAPAHDADGRAVPESARLSRIGHFLRRTRLDELPQLVNILIGEMSFIGPRPLLPADQPTAYAARLLVRPGLTGWAQVGGGREMSAANKSALDLWYVNNASLALDFVIFVRTARMLVFGERTNTAAIRQAWRDLQRSGMCLSGDLATGQLRFDASTHATQVKTAA